MEIEYAIAKISTKGQIVLPSHLRKGINKGEEFLLIKYHDRIIMKKMKDMVSNLKENLKFAEKVEKAWKEQEKGKFIKKSKDDFLKELKAC